PLAEAQQQAVVGRLLAMGGEIDRAREMMHGARQVFADAGLLVSAGSMALAEGEMGVEAGDGGGSERVRGAGLGCASLTPPGFRRRGSARLCRLDAARRG